ncbi:MAG: hypothetical protein Q7T63_12975, partial [Burkholderiaceae bacterium]|nr:hypothetical protein [Burkholderiaceae bacterium]
THYPLVRSQSDWRFMSSIATHLKTKNLYKSTSYEQSLSRVDSRRTPKAISKRALNGHQTGTSRRRG